MKAPKQVIDSTPVDIPSTEPIEQEESTLQSTDFQPAPTEVLQLFPTNMLRGSIPLDMNAISNDVRGLVDKVKETEGNDTARNYTTYFNEEIRTSMHEFEWFKMFSNIIKDTYVEFCKNIYAHELDYLQRDDIHLFAWVSVYNEEHSHEVHNHVDSFMSGTWYIKTNEDTAPIKFISPNVMTTFQHTSVDKYHSRENFPNMHFMGTEWLENEVHFRPLESEFLLWPSYMQHMVPVNTVPQKENYERITLSFNLKHRLNINSNDTGHNMSYKGIL